MCVWPDNIRVFPRFEILTIHMVRQKYGKALGRESG